MPTLTASDKDVLRRYTRAIYHLRAQLHRKKLMPIFGAGTGRAIGLPDWAGLVDRLSEHPEVDAHSIAGLPSSQATRSHVIFQHFKKNFLTRTCAPPQAESMDSLLSERRALSKWREVVRDCLYQDARPVSSHPYLAEFVPVIRKAPLTVNYNFDDSVQELLDASPSEDDERGFETVWEPTVQYRYSSSVIYHPNGFLPKKLSRGPSGSLVFLEDSFADQLVDAQRGHYATLLSHLYRFTGLLVGLSLSDPTLKHLLRTSAIANPGHVHYYVAYREGPADDARSTHQASRTSNFETYNLVTLSFNSEEIKSLANLLCASDDEIFLATQDLGLPISYTFYLSGAVGVGKTTALSRFKSLNSFDEWLDPKPELVMKASDQLTALEKEEVDAWIDNQMSRRNLILSRKADAMINIVDRSPLDPIAFSKTSGERRKRAAELRQLYARSKAGPCRGKVVLLAGNPEVMHARIVDRHKQGSPDYIGDLQNRFLELWAQAPAGVKKLNCVDLDLSQLVKRISRVIHLDDYEEVDFSELLDRTTS